ncbi:MAG: hypothetical protein ABSB96_09700 [Gaiellaceae bacterium]
MLILLAVVSSLVAGSWLERVPREHLLVRSERVAEREPEPVPVA